LCEELLEPLQDVFGRVAIRSAYRSAEVNRLGNAKGYNCASNERSAAGHIWDLRDAQGQMGATACIVVPRFANEWTGPTDWKRIAWWVHEHLPYSTMEFFPVRWAFNLQWHEKPLRMVYSHIPEARGYLTKPGMPEHDADHRELWEPIVPA